MNAYKISYGSPEAFTPCSFNQNSKIDLIEIDNSTVKDIEFFITDNGCRLELPIEKEEQIYGFGLQLRGFNHKGGKKHIRPNADPVSNSGDSHAPVPFYVTTKGYGIYVDTSRYVTFYCGYTKKKAKKVKIDTTISTSTESLYATKATKDTSNMIIDIPTAKGVDIYIFKGNNITEAVSQYNLFSGGGCMPALWGLGMFYRCYTKFTEDKVLEMARYFRNNELPCDILGLEPGWQSSSYSCSYVWDKGRYPDYENTLNKLKGFGFRVNLWEHAFTNPSSPMYDSLYDFSGDYTVWNGLVPDFATEGAAQIFSDYHKTELVEKGITGFKLDECDGSDFTGGWSFPNCTTFPSGLDGECMHSLFGTLYIKTLLKSLGNKRTLSEVRNIGALAAPYPFVLYSDLYAHSDFIRGLANSGFSGILWSPEVRDARSKSDLIRRVQSVIFSPQALINAWYIEKAPWLSLECESEIRDLFNLRMSLVPYLYSAFYSYYKTGKAPIRALISDYSDDTNVYGIDNEYLFGDNMLIAPMTENETKRTVYLPSGIWYDFWSNKKYNGGTHEIETENIPVFVKENSIIPFAEPEQFLSTDTKFKINLKCYGEKGSFDFIVDDGETYTTNYKVITTDFDGKIDDNFRYTIKSVQHITENI